MNESSVFQNVYLSKYHETEQQQKIEREKVSFRILVEYLETVISTFKWNNVKNVHFFMPEKFFLYSARLGVFKHNGEAVIAPIYPAGALMEDGEYTSYTAIFPNGTSVRLNRDDVSIIFGNSLKLPMYGIIKECAEKSSFALNAVDTALRRAMLPPLFGASTDEALKKITELEGRENLLKTICAVSMGDGYGEKEMQRIPIYDNRETDVLSLWDVYSRYDRMFYRTFGISTVGIQKNERLTRAESTGEEEMTRYTLFQDMYNCRQEGIAQANEKFGTDFSIEIMRDNKTVFEATQSNEEKIQMEIIEASRGSSVKEEENNANLEENAVDN